MRGKGKRGRHLARYVSIFLLSGGYTLPSLLPVYAADVTVPEVVVDASHPAVTMSEPGPINQDTTPTPPHREPNRNAVVGNAADLPLAGDVRNVVGNKLTIRATSAATMAGILNLYAGRTYGTGNANGNVLTVDGFFSFPPLVPNPASTSTNPLPGYATLLYGGYSEHGNADGNFIIIKDVVDPNAFSPNPWAYNKVGVGGAAIPYSGTIYAGYAPNGTTQNNRVELHNAAALGDVEIYGGSYSVPIDSPSYDNRLEKNVLQITSADNRVKGIYDFKTMEFVLDNSLNAADSHWSNPHLAAGYMLYLRDNTKQKFDWDQIVVKNYQSWFDTQIAHGYKTPYLNLCVNAAMTAYNYAPTLLYNNDDYEYGKTATTDPNGAGIENPTGICTARNIRLLGLRYKNATETLTAQTPQLHESSPKGSYAGVSIYGNTTENNVLTIRGGTHTAARAGYTIAKNGSTKNNTLTITGGTVGEAYGGWTEGQNLLASTTVDETHPVAVNAGANAEAEGNTLNLSGGTIGANGKIAGGYIAKYTLHQSHLVSAGDVKTNKVNISGGTIGDNTAIYGGYTEGSGNATDNEVTISDGTFGNGVAIHGGATAGRGRQLTANPDVANDTVAASKATGNSVTIEGGTFGTGMDIYGGNTGGTGAATGNTITLGADELAMGGVFLHGGYGAAASDVMTDNTLNVKGKNITVRGVENFGKTNFDLAHKTVGDTLLKITGGATNNMGWAGVEVVQTAYSFTPKSYDKHLFILMDNEDGINFMKGTTDTYATIGVKERTIGDYEFVIDTDNHTGHANRYVYADGFRFHDNADASYTAADGTHNAAWSGRTAAGHLVSHNTLTVTGGSVTNAYGAYVANNKRDASGHPLTTGDADTNTLVIARETPDPLNPTAPIAPAPAITGNAYGARIFTKAGSAAKSSVLMSAGTVGGNLYGGAVMENDASGAASGAVTESTIHLSDAAQVTGNVYGGYTIGAGRVADSVIQLQDEASVGGSLYGGYAAGTGAASGAQITLQDKATVGGDLYGGYTAGAGAASGATITLKGAASVAGDLYGGFSAGTGATTGNVVNLGDGTQDGRIAFDETNKRPRVTSVTGTIYGGSDASNTTGNILNVNGNAAVGNIKNFAAVKFYYNQATTSAAAPMLKITDGVATAFDWSTFDYTGGIPMSGKLTIMANAAGINVANYTGARDLVGASANSEITIDTENHTASSKKIVIDGLTFRYAKVKPEANTIGTDEEDVWGGRSVLGNTTTHNVLTIDKGTEHRDAYGGWTAGKGTTRTAKKDSTENTVNLVDGKVRNIYGGFTASADASAAGSTTKNTVNLSGGEATGTVYGGFISHTGAGDATGNAVTITGGKMKDVYGGYTNGSGQTTGNTVTIGDGTNALPTGTNIAGYLYGGNKAVDTDNKLVVNTAVSVKNIKHFEKLSFNISRVSDATTPLLTLTDGVQTGGLDWDKVEVTGANNFVPSTYRTSLATLMHNDQGIDFTKAGTNTYNPIRAKNRVSGDLEYTIDTDNHTVTAAKEVYVDGFRFRHNKGADGKGAKYLASDGMHAAAWSGRTGVGNKVEDNVLVVSGGTLTTAAYGGLVENKARDTSGNLLTTGDAEGNTLRITGGTVAAAYGANVTVKDGAAKKNTAEISGGTVTGNVYGGALTAVAATKNATGGSAHITGGSVGGNVYGGAITDATASGNVTGSSVHVAGGTVSGTVYGGHNAGTGTATGGTVTITGGHMGAVYGGYTATTGAETTGNTINLGTADTVTPTGTVTAAGTPVAAGTSIGNIYGGNQSAVTNNILNVYSAATAANVDKFERVNFNVTSNVTAGSTMLTLTDGAASHIDWAKLRLTNLNALIPSNTTGHLLTLVAGTHPVSFDNYAGIGAVEKRQDGDYEYVLDTDTHSASAQQVTVMGYRFQNSTKGHYRAGTATEAWGGRSTIGNKVQNNALLVTGGTLGAAYGGVVENYEHIFGGTENPTGDAATNYLTVRGGTISRAYGADVRTRDGSVTDSHATLAGGSVTGSLYGGALTHANATGTATGNSVTITGGTVGGDVYAAYTTGTGATTGNKVYLGDGQSAIAVGTRVTGTIYGGSGTDVTDNELQVQGAGVTAGSIAHFSKVHFALNDYVPDGANVLSLTQNTALPFATVTEPTYAELSGWLGDAMEKSAHLFQMQGSALTLNGYTPGNRLRRLGDIEYVFGTDNDAGTTTGSFDLSVYRWRHDTTDITGTMPYIFGGRAVRGAAGETLRNRLRLKAGAYVYTAIGGDTQTPSGMAQENTITIEAGAQITQSAIGGKTRGGLAEKNAVIVTGGQVQGNVYGADSAGPATGNGVFVTGGTIGADLFGARATGLARENEVQIESAVTGAVTGASSTGASAVENAVVVRADVAGSVTGGAALYSASANRVEITGAVIAGNVTGGSGAQTDDNQILLSGATVTGDVVGGTSAGGTGNTLAIYPGQSAIHDFSGVQKLRFYLPNDARASYTPMLQLGVATKDIRNLNIGVGFSGSAPVLRGNDVISLMKTLPGGTLLTDADIANQIEGTQGVTMRYQFALQKRGTDELVLTLIGAAMNDQTKSLVEPRCGATDFINRGADLLAASGISSAAKEGGRTEDDEKRGYQLWAAMSQGTMRAETGSYVTTNGYNLSVGWAKEGKLRAAKTLFTPFVEYGRGTYHTYLDDGTHGNGKISYLGAGLMGRIERPDGCWAEAALHGGRVRSSYSGDVSVGTVSTYDSENAYYAAHIGIGKTRLLRTGDTLNTYLRYFYSRQNGVSAQLNTGETYDFDAVASHRMRVGFTFLHREDASKEIYAGLAYEYEFDGEGAASYQGLATDRPALRGGSTMVELGYRFIPPDSRLSYHVRMAGWQGTRRGMTGNAQVSWAF